MHGEGLPSDRGSLQRRTAGMRTPRCSITPRHDEFQMEQLDVFAFTSISADIKSQLSPLLTAA